MEPMPLRISVTRGFVKEQTTSLALTLQEADSAEGEWQDVPGAAITVQGAELGEGARLGWRSRAPGRAQELAAPQAVSGRKRQP